MSRLSFIFRLGMVVSLGLVAAPQALADTQHYAIDTQTTSLELSWQVLGVTNSHASFSHITGNVVMDEQSTFNDSINVTIPVSTIDAHNRLLTGQLKSPGFFNQPTYPQVTFTSTRVVAEGNSHYRVFGNLRIKNITRPVILDAQLSRSDSPAANQHHLAFNAVTAIQRSAFGMTQYIPMVSDKIEIAIAIDAIQS
ncbi:polyisoprenoid-binding protein [Paramixta manurensis]|uniref:Polyisoprenoid-binding protein n=1 Tax=Paramixta manurensis TaxID=2740817 RepID=A0A6M8UAA0_9GAMM|nr:polyisoprenoid-binding protein [Erwiniaceae bacterium PD-1]